MTPDCERAAFDEARAYFSRRRERACQCGQCLACCHAKDEMLADVRRAMEADDANAA